MFSVAPLYRPLRFLLGSGLALAGFTSPSHAQLIEPDFAFAGATPASHEQTIESDFALQPCTLPGIQVAARCGDYPVYENRAAASGRVIHLRVVVLPATGSQREDDPVVFFAGGPGASTVQMANSVVSSRAADLQQRDFVFIDYRGTGNSNPLICPYQEELQRSVAEALESFIPLDQVANCYRQLSAQADLSQYHTQNIVDDIAEVTAALGYKQLNLWGGSYGTRAILMLLRRHEQRIRTAVLEGVTPMDARAPQYFARDAQAALDAWLAECAAEADCAAAFPDSAGELKTLLAQLEEHPQQVKVSDPAGEHELNITLSRNAFIQTLRYQLYSSSTSLNIPAYLHAAAQGDWQPIAEAAYDIGVSLLSSLPDGLFLSVTCSEDVAFIDAQADALQIGFMGDFRLRQQRAACRDWPVARMDASYLEPVKSAVPSLIISGTFDPVTPVHQGEAVARYLSNSRHMRIPYGAHSPFGLRHTECIEALQHQFLQAAKLDDLAIEACSAGIQRPGFLLSTAPERVIELSAEQQQAFVGEYYSSENNFSLSVVWENQQLSAQIGEQRLLLQAVSENRFIIPGAPPGSAFEFDQTPPHPQVKIQWARSEPQVLQRRP